MGVQVTFDYAGFLASWPEFTPGGTGPTMITQEQAQAYFDIATSFHRNDGLGPVSMASIQTSLLNLVVAHLAKLFAPGINGQPASDLVGRITNASQGSVSVASELNTKNPSADFWNQTKYGLAYWATTAPYRTMRYIPGRQRYFGPYAPGYGEGGDGFYQW